jgi:glycosyltransferase involved in cell wall biosynthesis
MRILMVNDRRMGGGAEVYVEEVGAELTNKGHEVIFFFIEECLPPAPGTLSYYLAHNFFSRKVHSQLKETIDRLKPDVIHLHNNYLYPNSVLAACRGRRVVQKCCDWGLICPTAWGVRKDDLTVCDCHKGLKCGIHCLPAFRNLASFIIPDIIRDRMIRENVNRRICPSKTLTETMSARGYRNCTHLPNFKAIKRIDEPTYPEKFLYVGRLEDEKGVGPLIEAFQDVASTAPSAKLTLAGGGNRKKYEDKAASLGLKGKVEFLGQISHPDTLNLYHDARALIIPSIWMENSPHVAYEAMAAALPIIAFDAGGLPELIRDGFNGFLVRRADTKALAERMTQLLNDKELAARLGKNGRSLIENEYGPEEHVKKLIAIYADIAEDQP